MTKKFFLKKRRTTRDIFQYWSVFSGILGKSGQYLVSILGKVVSIVVSILIFFLQTTVFITDNGNSIGCFCCEFLAHTGTNILTDITNFHCIKNV